MTKKKNHKEFLALGFFERNTERPNLSRIIKGRIIKSNV